MVGFFKDIIFLPKMHSAENIYFAFLDTKDKQAEERKISLQTYGWCSVVNIQFFEVSLLLYQKN